MREKGTQSVKAAAAPEGAPRGDVTDLRDRYLAAVLAGERARAAAVVEEALRARLDAATVLGPILGAAQAEVGARWKRRELSVSAEHWATEVTREELERVRLARRPQRPLGYSALVSAAPGEPHALPARIFATLLDCRGWSVDFLGQAPPDFARHVEARRPKLLALSVTMKTHVAAARELCRAVSAMPARPRILLGGAAVQGLSPRSMSADAIAGDAASGADLAAELVGASRRPNLDEYLGAVGRRVHRLRRDAGLSQEKLAERCGLARPYLGAIEHGRQNITLGAALRIATALGTSMTDLLGEEPA